MNTTALNPQVAAALAQIELDKQAAIEAGLYSDQYERCLTTLGERFIEANDVDPVIDALIWGMVTRIAKEHGLEVARANESAEDQFDGQIIVWPESGLVIVPHSMSPLDALDQLRAHVAKGVA